MQILCRCLTTILWCEELLEIIFCSWWTKIHFWRAEVQYCDKRLLFPGLILLLVISYFSGISIDFHHGELQLWCEELSEIILLFLEDENPFLEPKTCYNNNHAKPIKPPMLSGNSMLTVEGDENQSKCLQNIKIQAVTPGKIIFIIIMHFNLPRRQKNLPLLQLYSDVS